MKRTVCILLALLSIACVIPLAACMGGQGSVYGSQGSANSGQGSANSGQSSVNNDQGSANSNQSSGVEDQDPIIGVWAIEDTSDFTLASEDISYHDTWRFESTGMIRTCDQYDPGSDMLVGDSMHVGNWEKQGNGYHIKVYFWKEDLIGTGRITSAGGTEKLTLSLNDGRTLVFTRCDR